VGLEWQFGPSVRFGLVNDMNSRTTTENGVVVSSFANDTFRFVKEPMEKNLRVGTFLSFGWRF
jgi:hypothetical protein